jgi:hypothetical protein
MKTRARFIAITFCFLRHNNTSGFASNAKTFYCVVLNTHWFSQANELPAECKIGLLFTGAFLASAGSSSSRKATLLQCPRGSAGRSGRWKRPRRQTGPTLAQFGLLEEREAKVGYTTTGRLHFRLRAPSDNLRYLSCPWSGCYTFSPYYTTNTSVHSISKRILSDNGPFSNLP